MAGNSDVQPKAKKPRGPGKPFAPGVSGNPSGRPKDVHALREMIRAKGESLVTVLALIAVRKEEKSADRIRAAEVLLSYGFGKPVQSVEMSGPAGGPIETASDDPVSLLLRRLAAKEATEAEDDGGGNGDGGAG